MSLEGRGLEDAAVFRPTYPAHQVRTINGTPPRYTMTCMADPLHHSACQITGRCITLSLRLQVGAWKAAQAVLCIMSMMSLEIATFHSADIIRSLTSKPVQYHLITGIRYAAF